MNSDAGRREQTSMAIDRECARNVCGRRHNTNDAI